mgnify:CR=1 FL=1
MKKMYTFMELEKYFNKYGMNWIGRGFEIYCLHDKKSDEDKYVIDDYDYAFKKNIQYTIKFDFTSHSVDWENIEESIRLYNESHDDKIKLDSTVIANYIISCITNAEVE